MTKRYLLLTVPTGPIYPLEAGFGHLRHYDLQELRHRIERLGFAIARATSWGFPFMTMFKWASNLRPATVSRHFASGVWTPAQRVFGQMLTWLFYANIAGRGPQLFILARAPGVWQR